MMMSLGQFVFGLSTIAFTELQDQLEYRHAENSRVGAPPSTQYLGEGARKLTLSGMQVPELGDRTALQRLQDMAATGAAYALTDGTGAVWGAFVITGIQKTGSNFVAQGLPLKTTFAINLSSADTSRVDPTGGADDSGGTGWDFDAWDWWLGL